MTRVTQQITIPEPTNDPDALWRSVSMLKEAVELLQGIRGNRAAVVQEEADVIFNDLEDRLFLQESKGFAGMYVKGNTSTTTLNSSAKVQVVNFNANGPYEGVLPDHTNDHLTVSRTGIYFVNVTLTVFNSSGAAHVLSLDLYKNNGATVYATAHADHTLGTGTEVNSIGLSGFIAASADDTIELWADTNSGSDRNVTFADVSLSVFEVR